MADTYPPHALGRLGEAAARALLERAGWKVLAHNYRFGRREVDLVVRRDGLVAFVEVKTRAGVGYGAPEDAVTARKRLEIEAVARDFLWRRRLDGLAVRFDVVAVAAEPGRGIVRIEHFEDAWRPEPPR